jgi:hypothetical protein
LLLMTKLRLVRMPYHVWVMLGRFWVESRSGGGFGATKRG